MACHHWDELPRAWVPPLPAESSFSKEFGRWGFILGLAFDWTDKFVAIHTQNVWVPQFLDVRGGALTAESRVTAAKSIASVIYILLNFLHD